MVDTQMDISGLDKESMSLLERYAEVLKKVQNLRGTPPYNIAKILKGNYKVIHYFDDYNVDIVRLSWVSPTIIDVERLLRPYSMDIEIKSKSASHLDIYPRNVDFSNRTRDLFKNLDLIRESMYNLSSWQ
jgi:hypothetical protein